LTSGETHDTESVLAAALPDLGAGMAGHVMFSHAALLIFVDTLDGLAEELATHGIQASRPVRVPDRTRSSSVDSRRRS
jgi:hypothetical protein